MNKNQGPAPPARGLTICLSYGLELDRDRAAGNCLEARVVAGSAPRRGRRGRARGSKTRSGAAGPAPPSVPRARVSGGHSPLSLAWLAGAYRAGRALPPRAFCLY